MAAADDADSPRDGGQQRRLTVIMHADVAVYSRQMEADETGTHARLIACRRLIDAALAAHGGRLVGSAGGAVLATVASVAEGLAASIALQRAMAAQNAGLPADRQLLLRIGLDLGDVIIDGDEIFETGVNVAARLEAMAEPGGIVVASAVRDQAIGKLDVAFEDRGLCRVENIALPIRIFAVAEPGDNNRAQRARPWFRRHRRWVLAAVAAVAVLGAALASVPGWRSVVDGVTASPAADEPPASPLPVGKPVIAVLPFADRGGAGEQDYFSDGVTEDVIRALGRFSGLQVLSWSAVAPVKGQPVDLDAISEELGARCVVGGTIQRAGEQLRVSVELSDAARGVLLWSERSDEPLADIFAVQDRFTRQVVSALAVRVTQVEREMAYAKPTTSLGAYDLVLHGRDLLRRVERDANYDARAKFERAIAIDPRYADACVGLGWTHLSDFL